MKDYNSFLQKALYHVVKDVLNTVAKEGLTDESYYVLSFQTPNATIPPFVRAKYPEEMTIILQHQFSELSADETAIHVTVGFGGVPSAITIPYTSLISFVDPAQKFGLTFTPQKEQIEVKEENESTAEVIDLASRRKKK